MIIIVRPLGRGRFAALLADRTRCASGTPLLSAARVLQTEGMRDDTPLEMVHEGSATVAFRSTVGTAARLRVTEVRGSPRFVPWRPDQLPASMPAHCAAETLDGKATSCGYRNTSGLEVGLKGAAATRMRGQVGWERAR
jgi:hypothetical protein